VCRLTNLSRATPLPAPLSTGRGEARVPRKPPSSGALSEAERQQVPQLLNSPQYADLAPAQVWARELDQGRGAGP
jgi:putative transposase